MRLPLALFIRRLLSEFPLHLLQLAPALWEHCVSQCILWHRIHGQDLSREELLSCIEIRQITDKSGTYSPYSLASWIIGGRVPTLSWQRQWFFLGGPWEILTYGAAQVGDHVPRVICMPRWAKVEKADFSEPRRVVDDVFALKVSLRSSDYITEEDLRSYGLAPVDDENGDGPLVTPSSGVGVPPSSATDTLLATSPMIQPAVPSSVPQVVARPHVMPTSEATTRRKSIPTRARKAPRVRAGDAPSCTTTTIDMDKDESPSFLLVRARAGSGSSGPSFSRTNDVKGHLGRCRLRWS